MGTNPYDPNDTEPYIPLSQRKPVEVPISGANPYDPPPTGVMHEYPGDLVSNTADVAKAASNAFSFGMRDRLEGLYRRYISGEAPTYSAGVDQAVADTAMRRERSPYLSVAGDVAGGTAQAFIPGIGATGRSISAALGGAGRGAMPAVARTIGYGIEGGLLGGAQAAGNTYTGKPEDYARNAVIGGALGTVLGAPFGAAFADVAPRSLAEIPNSERLLKSSGDRYRQTHSIPVDYSTSEFRSAMDAFEKRLYGITDPDKSKSVWHVLNDARSGRLQADPNSPTISPKDIDALRQKLTGNKEPGAYQLRQFLDVFMSSPIAQVSGTNADRAAIARTLNAARGDYRAAKRTQTIEESNQYAADKGTDPAKDLTRLLNPKSREGKWYTPEEKADIRSATRKDAAGKAVEMAGTTLGGGGGPWGPAAFGAGGVGGAFASGSLYPLLGIGAPIAGMGLRAYGNRLSAQSAQNLADTMAMRSPLYRQRAAAAPTVAGPGLGNVSEATRNALTIEMLNQLRMRGGLYGEQ